MPLLDLENQIDVNRYQDFAKNSPYAKATQDINWSKVKSNWEPYYIYLEKNDEIIAAMSILTVNSVNGKKLAYCSKGPLCDIHNVQLVCKLYDEAEKYLPDDVFLLRSDPEFFYDDKLNDDLKEAGFIVRNKGTHGHDTIQPRLNMCLDLEGKTEDELLASFHSKTRYNIRLAKRRGIEIESSSNPEDADLFYTTYKIMSERQGITYRNSDYFKRLVTAFQGNARVFLAKYNGEVLAAAICMSYGDRCWYMFGGSTNEHRNLMPNYLMQWEMIKWAVSQGKKYYDFGGVFKLDKSDGLYNFKRGFVGDDNVTEYIGEIDRVFDQEAYDKFLE